MAYIVYGIKNCDTVKKALNWLESKKITWEFHDYKSKGIAEAKLKEWCKQTGWESLVNKKGTTWRQLDDALKTKIVNEKAAIDLMVGKTSIIKRPLIEKDGKIIALGFDATNYSIKF
jgi:Spx/MgsR family transcriptional regulator